MKKIIILLAVFLTACAPAVEQPQAILPIILATPTGVVDPSYPNAQAPVVASNQITNGIEVRMEGVSMAGKNLNANVCFTLPDTSDWGILSASLTYGGTMNQEFGTTLAALQPPADGVAGLRCDTLTFIVPPDADLSNAVITINSIGTTPRADDYCSLYMPKIQQALMERGVGIVLECVDVNGALAMQITSFPPEMTQQQAEELVYSDEFYAVKGPWNFSFNLAQ